MISFEKISVYDEMESYRNYTAGLRLVDTYWEDLIFNADVYRICIRGEMAGCFSIGSHPERREYGYLTSFLVREAYLYHMKSIFEEILRRFAPKGAYVVTSDEYFLSFAMDYQKSVELQAYFFDFESDREEIGEYPSGILRRAVEEDLPDLEKTDFYHPLTLDSEENQIYVFRDETGEFLGTGHIARMQLDPKWGCVGMYTVPKYRRKGVGSRMILSMVRIAREQQLIPIAGCYYQNNASRTTLERCGFYSKTRYLRISF